MSLLEKQALFARLLAELVTWIFSQGYKITKGEGSIATPRKVSSRGVVMFAEDRMHMADSLHYIRLAEDLNLFIDGEWISDGGDPAWTVIGTHWEGMNTLCRWGGRFVPNDSNHFSLEFEGRA